MRWRNASILRDKRFANMYLADFRLVLETVRKRAGETVPERVPGREPANEMRLARAARGEARAGRAVPYIVSMWAISPVVTATSRNSLPTCTHWWP